MGSSSLPKEIREAIWLLSIPEEEPEVCLLWPVVLHERYEGQRGVQATQPLLVDTAWPVAMHVCSDSRSVMHNQKLSGLLFRDSSSAGCLVPYRAFRPELDTLYWGGESFEAMMTGPGAISRTVAAMPVLASIQSLALELRWACNEPSVLLSSRPRYFPALRTIAVVLPSSKGSAVVDHRMGFRQPARRCKLETISPEVGSEITVRTNVVILELGGDNLEVPLSPEAIDLVMSGLRITKSDVNKFITHHFLAANGIDTDLVVSAYEPDVIAQTFVEYQTDGSWKEVCSQRTFLEFGEMVRSGPYVPYDLRPDPTQVRVNDIDGTFDVVYDSGTPDGHASDW
ncbi:hypothetical protein NLG97_g8936 [Lecanicillium saksenae]|uniref:Uncharacterized protein n=1 Tax=Lecanicillium saksenae TaxID=468837 RepID=A0ACC1QHG5_9HYPO|nr:hypothetical protein NLG97_g8936 [Lecanicillium saksenae]